MNQPVLFMYGPGVVLVTERVLPKLVLLALLAYDHSSVEKNTERLFTVIRQLG